jgi:hypothetical protein
MLVYPLTNVACRVDAEHAKDLVEIVTAPTPAAVDLVFPLLVSQFSLETELIAALCRPP